MCKMCESSNYDALLELQAQYYFLKNTEAAPASLLAESRPSSSKQPTNENSWTELQCRRGSLSTCFKNLHIQRTQASPSSMLTRRVSTASSLASNSPSPASSLLSPPSSPKSTALPLVKVMEADEYQATIEDRAECGEAEHEPCRRFQRQILSRLQALSPQGLEHQPQQHTPMLIVSHQDTANLWGESVTNGGHRFTPPPSPDPYEQKQRRLSSTNSLRPSTPSTSPSRKGSIANTPRSYKIRLPSVPEMQLGIPPASITSPRLASTLSTSHSNIIYERRVSSPGPLSHLDSRGGIRKPGCGRKSNIEILGNNTPFKSGWSFSTAYGRGK